jgi:dihydropyrimidinase
VFDPTLRRVIRSLEMQSAADYDPFEGWAVTGWPTITISRGDVIYADRKPVASPGRGRLQLRSRFPAPKAHFTA